MADGFWRLNKRENNRIEWVDFCKFLSMFLVVWLHFGARPKIDGYIHLFHMPIFYYLSGVCHDRSRSFKQLVVKRFKSLLVPYIIVSFIVFLITDVVHICFSPSSVVSYTEYLRHLLVNCTEAVSGLGGSVQWFLPSLFFTELIFSCINKLNSPIYEFCLCIILAFTICFFVQETGVRLPIALDTSFAMIPFYCIGHLMREWKTNYLNDYIGVVVGGGISVFIFWMNGVVNIRLMEYGNYLLFTVGACGGIMMLTCISKILVYLLKSAKVNYDCLLFLGQNTIITLYLHRVFITIVKECIIASVNNTGYYYRLMFDLTIVYTIVSIPVIILLNKAIAGILGGYK